MGVEDAEGDTHVPRAALGDDERGQARARAELEHVEPAIECRGALEVARQRARRVPPREFLGVSESGHATHARTHR